MQGFRWLLRETAKRRRMAWEYCFAFRMRDGAVFRTGKVIVTEGYLNGLCISLFIWSMYIRAGRSVEVLDCIVLFV